MDLVGTETQRCLVEAFALESQAVRRLMWMAEQADVEGRPELASVFRSMAEIDSGLANGHLEYLAESGDPETGLPIGDAEDNVSAVKQSITEKSQDRYPSYAATAREEGFEELAEWFESTSRAHGRAMKRLTD